MQSGRSTFWSRQAPHWRCWSAALRLWRYDLSVPFYYWGDTLLFAALVQGLILDGWPHHISGLSAPLGFDAVAFPSLSSSDWLVMRLLVLLVDTPGAVLNVFWLLPLVLSKWSCALALRLLGARRLVAVVSGIVYALLSYAFIRSASHISLVY